jgi:hypothetical protein
MLLLYIVLKITFTCVVILFQGIRTQFQNYALNVSKVSHASEVCVGVTQVNELNAKAYWNIGHTRLTKTHRFVQNLLWRT